MIPLRLPLTVLLALVAGLLAATPALAGGVLSLDGDALVYTGDDAEPNNVMFDLAEGADTIVVRESGSRMTLDASILTPAPPRTDDRTTTDPATPGATPTTPTTPGGTTTTPTIPGATTTTPTLPATPDRSVPLPPVCTLSEDGYVAECAVRGVARIRVTTSNAGSDVRIRADLPAQITGGDGDDLLIGGPADDVVSGGDGMDVVGGGGGADELRGGRGDDLITYVDRIARDGELLPRRGGVTVRPGARGASGGRGEGDTIFRDLEQIEGGGGNDRFELRDGIAQSVACNAGHDVAILDPLDDEAIDCERGEVAAAPGERMTTPTLVFPFPDREDRAASSVVVKPQVSLQGNAVVVRIRCQIAIGLLAADGPGCSGRVRMVRAGGAEMAERTIEEPRGREISWRVPLTSSLSLARRAGGLPVTVTAFPARGSGVRRDLRFTVRG